MMMPPFDQAADRLRSGSLMRALCLFVIFFLLIIRVSGYAIPGRPSLFAIFKPLEYTLPEKRADKAIEIYKSHYRHLNEPVLMAVIDSVQQMAQRLDDPGLECSTFLMRADYYSVNRGFNELSINYHQKAIEFAIARDLPVQVAVCLHKKGLYYFTFNHNAEACRYFLQAMDKFRQIGFDHVPGICIYLLEQAKFYYQLKDNDTAKPLLETVLRYPTTDARVQINVINTLGLIYRNSKQYGLAMQYFTRTLNTAQAHRDSAWVGIAKGNIGSVYFMQHLYDKALPYLYEDYHTSIHFTQYGNAALTLLRISRTELERNALKDAALHLDTVQTLIQKSVGENVLGLLVELYDQRVTLCQHTGRLAEAVAYSRKFETARDSLNQRNSIAAIERVKLTWETEKYRDQIAQIRTRADVDAFKRNAVIFILFLLMIIFVLVFNRFRLNAKRDQEMLMIRKKRVDEKLKAAAESLQRYTENLKQNNALIEKFKAEMERFRAQSTDQAGAELLEKHIHAAHIMTDDSWSEFKKLFTRVHSGFFTKLRTAYPCLTDTDMRLLSLIKLGLNNREMSNMLGITIEGIKKSKQRLRKKMELTADMDLEQTVVRF